MQLNDLKLREGLRCLDCDVAFPVPSLWWEAMATLRERHPSQTGHRIQIVTLYVDLNTLEPRRVTPARGFPAFRSAIRGHGYKLVEEE